MAGSFYDMHSPAWLYISIGLDYHFLVAAQANISASYNEQNMEFGVRVVSNPSSSTCWLWMTFSFLQLSFLIYEAVIAAVSLDGVSKTGWQVP